MCVCLRLDIWITLYRFIFLHRRFMRCPFLLVRFTVHFFSEVSFFILFSVFLTLVFKAQESPVSLRPHKNKGTLQMCVLQRSHRIDRRTFRIAPGIGSTVTVCSFNPLFNLSLIVIQCISSAFYFVLLYSLVWKCRSPYLKTKIV